MLLLFVLFVFTEKCIGEPVLLEQYVAVKDYKKQHHNDISLTNGYTMGVIEKHESGKTAVEIHIVASLSTLPRSNLNLEMLIFVEEGFEKWSLLSPLLPTRSTASSFNGNLDCL